MQRTEASASGCPHGFKVDTFFQNYDNLFTYFVLAFFKKKSASGGCPFGIQVNYFCQII